MDCVFGCSMVFCFFVALASGYKFIEFLIICLFALRYRLSCCKILIVSLSVHISIKHS